MALGVSGDWALAILLNTLDDFELYYKAGFFVNGLGD